MKSEKMKLVTLSVQLPQKAFDRIANKIRSEYEISNPEEIIARVMALGLLMTWNDDASIWMEAATYRNREQAARVAQAHFDTYSREDRPLWLTYRWTGKACKREPFVNPHLAQVGRKEAA